jgi:hypothetical protein
MSDEAPVTYRDFERLENKIDTIGKALAQLVQIDERQIYQGQRIGDLEKKAAKQEEATQRIDRKVDQWINRGIGVWFVVGGVIMLALASIKFLK